MKTKKILKGAIPFLAIMGLVSMSGEVAANNVAVGKTVASVEQGTTKKVNSKQDANTEVKAFASNSKSNSTYCDGCSGTCSGTCSGLCTGCKSCQGTCYGLCEGCKSCQGTCSGLCTGCHGSCQGYK